VEVDAVFTVWKRTRTAGVFEITLGSYEKLRWEPVCAVVGAGGGSGVAGGEVGSGAGVVLVGAAAGHAGSAGGSHFFLQQKILSQEQAEASWPARSKKEPATIIGATSFNMVVLQR
jgi:hypothetical protein